MVNKIGISSLISEVSSHEFKSSGWSHVQKVEGVSWNCRKNDMPTLLLN